MLLDIHVNSMTVFESFKNLSWPLQNVEFLSWSVFMLNALVEELIYLLCVIFDTVQQMRRSSLKK